MGCCSNKNCNRPKEEMLSADVLVSLLEDSSWALAKLLDIAKGGARFVGFKNDQVNELAATISAIVTENNYLKSLLGIFHPGKAKAEDAGVTITFGPRNEYSLFIPALTHDARTKLGTSLIEAGEQIKKKQSEQNQQQQYLPFSS